MADPDIGRERALHEIRRIKRDLGDRLLILAHHYQRPELVAMGDARGDSYELSKCAAESTAEWIVFCGVHFMAQSAAILARDDQRVFHPNPRAGCPMADMADAGQVGRAYAEIERLQERAPIPICYMNTMADVKAFVGRKGGAVCTSSNAGQAFRWAFERAECVLFVPDEHLGRNTTSELGLDPTEVVLYDPKLGELGGLDRDELARARVVLWAGFCHVHTWFSVDHIALARERWPGCSVHVHPECRSEVVEAADGSGSTGYLVRVAEEAEPGETLVIGTEVNLITRLAAEHPDKKIRPLDRSLCPNMYRISAQHLLRTLQQLPDLNRVEVAEAEREGARLALQRMLEIQTK